MRYLIEVDAIRKISHEVDYSSGWPTVFRRKSGMLVLVYSGGRDGHICPFGRVEMMASYDEGKSWSWPRVILDSGIDDRDAGGLETQQGTLLISTFSHSQYEYILETVEAGGRVPFVAEDVERHDLLLPDRLPAWRAARGRTNQHQREQQLGSWMLRSTDGGISWSPQYRSAVSSPHGPLLLKSGALLYVGKIMSPAGGGIGVTRSQDDGLTWKMITEIAAGEDHSVSDYHEPHAVQADDGRVIVQIRNHNEADRYCILQSESCDDGLTWSRPVSTGIWGFPSHLLKTNGGRLLMTYSHRRAPFGNCVRVSDDHGKSWSDELFISSDAQSPDLGYPSTVECSNGSFLTVWYEALGMEKQTILRQANWRLNTLEADKAGA